MKKFSERLADRITETERSTNVPINSTLKDALQFMAEEIDSMKPAKTPAPASKKAAKTPKK